MLKIAEPTATQAQVLDECLAAVHSLVWLQTRESGWILCLEGSFYVVRREVGFSSARDLCFLPHPANQGSWTGFRV